MTPTAVTAALERGRELAGPALKRAVERLSPDLRQMASYHFGWTDPAGVATSAPGGKGLRPALALLSAEAVGADASVGVPGAAAVELVHNYSLVHDDIIDGDTERHHRPTVWAVYGIGPAIVAGDAMANLAQQVALEASPEHGPAAAAVLAKACATMISGQTDDISFEVRSQVSVEECVRMSDGKTGALLGCAASIGAVLAGADSATVSALDAYGRHLGLAFQAVDDLLGIWGDPAVTGKPAGNDLRQRKKSLPVVVALASGGDASDELRRLLALPDRVGHEVGSNWLTEASEGRSNTPLGPDEVERAAYLVEAAGGRQWTAVRAKSHIDEALSALHSVSLAEQPSRRFCEIAAYILERQS